jgi:hypothetical protein
MGAAQAEPDRPGPARTTLSTSLPIGAKKPVKVTWQLAICLATFPAMSVGVQASGFEANRDLRPPGMRNLGLPGAMG